MGQTLFILQIYRLLPSKLMGHLGADFQRLVDCILIPSQLFATLPVVGRQCPSTVKITLFGYKIQGLGNRHLQLCGQGPQLAPGGEEDNYIRCNWTS